MAMMSQTDWDNLCKPGRYVCQVSFRPEILEKAESQMAALYPPPRYELRRCSLIPELNYRSPLTCEVLGLHVIDTYPVGFDAFPMIGPDGGTYMYSPDAGAFIGGLPHA